MSFPNKQDRLTCWNHRDIYWKCLDEKKSDDLCKYCRKDYEKFCPSQWVKHFDRKRDYLNFKNRLEKEGYSPPFPEKEKL
ncbi:PREDICTED: cytochrome c oxidase assembly factor 6 homolog [Ceratosolen solmsi marchali]|uniref:Cytochrome c oxidase assembly factor 6 homolog n=1 Tax=Ceratosolen solmsi marchali TaxID=326594 RepID=A0AAJ7DUR5_9HYME|nr:PREDICTED: cytochrome c oxidase assembly factor 6 homolog [Ceratosolen solmsi marchali]